MRTLPEPIRDDLAAAASAVHAAGERPGAPAALLALDAGERAPTDEGLADAVLRSVEGGLADGGRVVVLGGGAPTPADLAALRNRLWPALHLSHVYRTGADGAVEREDHGGRTRLEGRADGGPGWAVVATTRAHAMSPEVTAVKFDGKAAGWNGDPSSPAYGHFRWMRRLLAVLAKPRPGEGVLDAGSGAGWVGLEAARAGATLSAFDPSPEMVKLVERNAAALGVAVDARVGFMERPPFEGPFDLVLNSGVISFAPDPDVYLDGLDPLVKPGGRLVIGDLNPASRGFRRRRAERPLLPCRELSGLTRDEMARRLEARGYVIEWVRYYQNTYPFPELLHRTDRPFVGWAILQWNRLSSAVDAALGARGEAAFDSWIIGARKKETG